MELKKMFEIANLAGATVSLLQIKTDEYSWSCYLHDQNTHEIIGKTECHRGTPELALGDALADLFARKAWLKA